MPIKGASCNSWIIAGCFFFFKALPTTPIFTEVYDHICFTL